MEYCAKELIKRIDDYFVGAISKTELGEWANNAYYDLLKGGYIEKEKITIYPFIKIVSTFHLAENDKEDTFPCTEENVRMIQDILHGKKNLDFAVEISIPIQTYFMFKDKAYFDGKKRDFFVKLRDMILKHFKQERELNDEIRSQVELAMCMKRQDKVIMGILEEQIQWFLKILFVHDLAELGLQKNLKLYAKKSVQSVIEERLISYLDCYLGDRNFQLFIAFENGESNIHLIV